MPTLLVSSAFIRHYESAVREAWPGIEPIVLPADANERLDPASLERVDYAYFSGDVFPDFSRSFFAAAQGAPNLKWLHVFNAGVDAPIFQRMLERGVRLSTSAGSTAQPIAQSAIGGMLMLARPFLPWLEAQRRHAWEPLRGTPPPDLVGQRMTVVGLGSIGSEIARIAAAIGLEVTGVRRSPRRDADPVQVIVPPSDLPRIAAETDWLVIACPLTDETRGLVSKDLLAQLKPGAQIINIGRGEVIDEPAFVDAVRSGRVAGAYLDVVSQEPLPPDSPLWDLPNVIISPHNSAVAAGNDARANGYFLENLRRMAKGDALVNEVKS